MDPGTARPQRQFYGGQLVTPEGIAYRMRVVNHCSPIRGVSRQKSIVPGFDDLESKTHREVEELKSA
jgi:hypothetical protein